MDEIIEELRKNADTSVPSTETVKEQGPFLSLGQIGDLDIFNKGTKLIGTEIAPDASIKNYQDRTREEVLRNSFQLLTLKGSVYTIYVIAQAGNTANKEFVPRATTRLIRTIELERQYPDKPLASFDTSLKTSKLKDNNTPVEGQTKVKQLFNERY